LIVSSNSLIDNHHNQRYVLPARTYRSVRAGALFVPAYRQAGGDISVQIEISKHKFNPIKPGKSNKILW